VEAVSKKLVEWNPGFDGKLTRGVENGVVTEVQFITDNVTDISPVTALIGLKGLACYGSGEGKGKLSDLSSLMGMQLTALGCYNTKVSNLMPLKGMPLTKLRFSDTPVLDMLPLTGMKLTMLGCEDTPAFDLSPLRGMPLRTLYCCNTEVLDLSPLESMNLTEVCFTAMRITKGIDVIRQMKGCEKIGINLQNRIPAAELWKKYDAGEFGKPLPQPQ
jgi:hypothetical protein